MAILSTKTKLRLGVALAFLVLAGAPVRAAQIPCTEAALKARIALLNQNCSGDKLITFSCAAGTVIEIAENVADRSRDQTCTNFPEDDWSTGVEGCLSCPPASAPGATNPCVLPEYTFVTDRTITCPGVTIDGENKVTFELVPGCDDRLVAQGDPYGDTSMEGGDFIFRANTSNVTFKNFTYRYFWEGIQIWNDGDHATIENVTGIRSCDDSLSTRDSSNGGHVVKDSTFRDGKDKCAQVKGREVTSTTYPDYDIKFINNLFDACLTPVFIEDGRHYFEGNSFVDTSPNYKCQGPYFSHTTKPEWNPVVYFKNNLVQNCYEGVRVSGSATVVSLGQNRFLDNPTRGVAIKDNGVGLFEWDTFQDNGGSWSGNEGFGGIFVGDGGKVDAGGGSLTIDGQSRSSGGNNTFKNNASDESDPLDLHNATSTQVKAENNFWADDTPGDQVQGSVDFAPWLGAAPDKGGDAGPPPPPELWRTDKHPDSE